MSEKLLENFVFKLRELTLGKCELILNGSMELANKYHCDGIHITDKSKLPNIKRKDEFSKLIIGKSIHKDYKKENELENLVNYVHLGPAFKTKTHPTSSPIDRGKIKEICGIKGLSVILVGGINKYNLNKLINYKISGIAIMRDLLMSKDPESSYIELDQKLNESQ